MEVRTYQVPRVGSGTVADPYRPKYSTQVCECGNRRNCPCGTVHVATCEKIGVDGTGKDIMRDLPLTAWLITFRCHPSLWVLMDADPECVLVRKHACDCDMEAEWERCAPFRSSVRDAMALGGSLAREAIIVTSKEVLRKEMTRFNADHERHIRESLALVGK